MVPPPDDMVVLEAAVVPSAAAPSAVAAAARRRQCSNRESSASFDLPRADRGVDEDQPLPQYNKKSKRFWVGAAVWRMGTGNAARIVLREHVLIWAPTYDAAVDRQRAYLQDCMQSKPRAAPAKRPAAAEPPQREPRARHASMPTSLAELKAPGGPRPSCGRAGPGRGHTYESTRPIEEQVTDGAPPRRMLTWLEERALREKWRTARIKELEAQVEQLLAENMSLCASRFAA
eukprot:scaffold7791_cov133-Isochrysis_galbana.AAC.4